MKKLIFLILNLVFFALSAQDYFNYQALIRDSKGEAQKLSYVSLRFSILTDSENGTLIYREDHETQTNSQGIVNLSIGSGTNKAGEFDEIDWSGTTYFLKVEAILPGISDFQVLGTEKIQTVPKASHANTASTIYNPENPIVGIGNPVLNPDGALFAVTNVNGDTVFAVYNEGVRVYVEDAPFKASSKKAGFAVGGLRAQKSTVEKNFFVVTPDSSRIYFNEPAGLKASSKKAGFAVGGLRAQKATDGNIKPYFDVSPVIDIERVDSADRLLWYPEKSAFMAGNVNFPSDKNLGRYSISLGYRPFASGQNSTAIGNYALAEGKNSYALGDSAVASNDNAYAFGTFAMAKGIHSYAFGSSSLAEADFSFALGTGAAATGLGSFAFGAVGLDTTGATTSSPTSAIGDYSFAMGRGSVSDGYGSLAMGLNSSAEGNYSIALGTSNTASGYASTAIGYGNVANSYKTFVVGTYNATSSNHDDETWDDTDPIFVIGNGKGTTYRFNVLKSGKDNVGGITINPIITPIINPIITIPNLFTNRSNAMMVFKNGNMLLGGGSSVIEDQGARLMLYKPDGTSETPNYTEGLVIRNPTYNSTGSILVQNWLYNFVFGYYYWGNVFEVDETGSVGIGSSASSSYKLYVYGDTRINGNIFQNANLIHSDVRLKQNITPISGALTTVSLLNGVRYNWKKEEFKDRNVGDEMQIGFIAQDIEKVLPELVKTDPEGYKAVDYVKVVPVLVEAIKEQQQMIDDQQVIIDNLLKRVEELELK